MAYMALDKTGIEIIIFFLLLHKDICCGYSLEAPLKALLMSTHNICFYTEMRKSANILAYNCFSETKYAFYIDVLK